MICYLIISIMIIISDNYGRMVWFDFFASQLCLCYLSGSDIHSLGLRSMLEITAAYSDDVSPLLQKNLVWLEVSFRFNVDYVLSLRRIGRWTSAVFSHKCNRISRSLLLPLFIQWLFLAYLWTNFGPRDHHIPQKGSKRILVYQLPS